jgi:hypothetical protein
MEIGSLIIWIVIIFAFGVWAFTFFSKMKDDSKPNLVGY